MTDIVRIELGASTFEAEVLLASLRDDGYQVELLGNTHAETGGAFALGVATLLIRAEDEEAIKAVLAESGY